MRAGAGALLLVAALVGRQADLAAEAPVAHITLMQLRLFGLWFQSWPGPEALLWFCGRVRLSALVALHMCSQLLLVAEADLAFRTLVWAAVPFHLQALSTLLTQMYLPLRLLFSGAVQFSARGRVSTALNRLRVRVPRA